jgi:hypothetical protein
MERVDMDRVWARAEEIHPLGVRALSLSREDTVLHLAWHMVHCRPEVPLLLAYEIGLFLRESGEALDWSYILSVARSTGAGPLLREAFGEVEERCGVRLPPRLLRALARARSRRLMERIACRVAAGSAIEGREFLALLLALRGIRPRIRFLAALLLPSPDYVRWRYGTGSRWRTALAYLQRWFGFLMEGMAGLLVTRRPGRR